MKILAVIIAIAGLYSTAEAVDCYQCIDTKIRLGENTPKSMAELLQNLIGGVATCEGDTSKIVSCGRFFFNACGATTVTYDIDFGTFSVTVEMTNRACSSTSVKEEETCKEVEKYLNKALKRIEGLTCTMETCIGDACNR